MIRILGLTILASATFCQPLAAETTDDQKALLARMSFVGGDYAAALAAAQPLADAGDPRSMTLLGVMNERGLGLPADPSRALELYQAAADKGFPQAIHNLAASYEAGELGLPEDPEKARALFARAAALDFGPSLGRLGVLLREGIGGPVDMVLSAATLERAVALGDAEGTAEYAFMLATGTGVTADLVRARRLYGVAAAHGIDWAERDYAEMMELGEGGSVDLSVALDFYRRSAAQGYGVAAFDIFELYRANPAALPEIKAEALTMCFLAEAQPPQWDGSEYDGKCDPAFGDYTAEEIAAAREAAAAL